VAAGLLRALRRLGAPVAAAAWLLSGFYSVQSDESALGFVLGRAVDRDVLPGIHWNPPWPIGEVLVARTATNFTMPVGYRLMPQPGQAPISDLWLTGDTNAVTGKLDVQYSIRSLADFELRHEAPRELLRRAGERSLARFLVGDGVDAILTTRRQALVGTVRDGVQAALDTHGTGIAVQSVSVQELAPPLEGSVRNAFQEVQNASADRERSVHEASAYRAQVLAEAQGEAERIKSAARAQRQRRIEVARGEAQRFLALAAEHARAPRVTEDRLYLEAVERLLPKLDTYVVEPSGGGAVNLRVLR
jgi:membrane protease subunit HflK